VAVIKKIAIVPKIRNLAIADLFARRGFDKRVIIADRIDPPDRLSYLFAASSPLDSEDVLVSLCSHDRNRRGEPICARNCLDRSLLAWGTDAGFESEQR
jgi:hypothetical protein